MIDAEEARKLSHENNDVWNKVRFAALNGFRTTKVNPKTLTQALVQDLQSKGFILSQDQADQNVVQVSW